MLIFLALLAVSPAAPPSTRPDPDPNDPVICRRSEAETGTHMRSKPTCMHKSQWDYLKRDAENQMKDQKNKLAEPSRAGNRATPQ